MKTFLVRLIRRFLKAALSILPKSSQKNLVLELIQAGLIPGNNRDNLRFLFELDNRLYSLQGWYSREYGGGLHSKHRHLKYYQFFADNLSPEETVFDVGTGNGYMVYQLVQKLPGIKVAGIELSEENYRFAMTHHVHPNLRFILGDVYRDLPAERFDVVTLSNVLEHFEDRVGLLKLLQERLHPSRFLIRVPGYERDWRVPLKDELGVDYRLDSTHFVEYTLAGFRKEMESAGLRVLSLEMRWGEILSVLEVAG